MGMAGPHNDSLGYSLRHRVLPYSMYIRALVVLLYCRKVMQSVNIVKLAVIDYSA